MLLSAVYLESKIVAIPLLQFVGIKEIVLPEFSLQLISIAPAKPFKMNVLHVEVITFYSLPMAHAQIMEQILPLLVMLPLLILQLM